MRIYDVARLWVRGAPSPRRNLVANPNGEFGGWGWTTTATGAFLEGGRELPKIGPTGRWALGKPWLGQYRLLYTTGTGVDAVTTEAMPCLEGQYVRAGWDLLELFKTHVYSAVLVFTTAEGSTVDEVTIQSFAVLEGGKAPAARLAPAGSVFVKLRITFYADTSGTGVPAGALEYFRDVRVKVADSAADLTGPNWDALEDDWTDVIGAASEVKVTRKDLDLGTLTATLHSRALDTARPDSPLRIGREVMLTVDVVDGGVPHDYDDPEGDPYQAGQLVRETLFRGRLTKPLKTIYPTGRKPETAITAADAIGELAGKTRPKGVASINGLRSTLEGCGVPWLINGSTAQIATPTTVSQNDSASAVDQIAVTRDSNLGYAWAARNGVLVANDRDNMPEAVSMVLDESRWSSIETGHDPAAVINVVKIDYLTYTGSGKSVIKRYGPYTNEDSIAKYGVQSALFTVHSTAETTASITALANQILALNADAEPTADSVTLPVSAWWRDQGAALLDLYDLVEVRDAANDLVDQVRIVGLEHNLAPSLSANGDTWTVVLTFDREGAVARPQRIPAP